MCSTSSVSSPEIYLQEKQSQITLLPLELFLQVIISCKIFFKEIVRNISVLQFNCKQLSHYLNLALINWAIILI